MAHFQEPRSPRALRSPPASPAKPAESPTSPTARKTAKRSLGETSPGGSRPPKPKRVNSYSELNFSSIVRVDSLGTMALPAFGEGGSASEDENSKRRPARAPSFGIDVDEEEEHGETEQRADTTAGATSMLAKIDAALSTLNGYRSKLGSVQNRLERSISNIEADIENATAANSRIRDVDFASETASFTRSQILIQSGTAILAQANSSPQAALSLLG